LSGWGKCPGIICPMGGNVQGKHPTLAQPVVITDHQPVTPLSERYRPAVSASAADDSFGLARYCETTAGGDTTSLNDISSIMRFWPRF